MSKWYLVTCAVTLGRARTVESISGRKASQQTAIGYVVTVGISGLNIVQASTKAHKVALAALDDNREENFVAEMEIKESSESEIRKIFEVEQTEPDGSKVYRSGLAYFSE